MTEYLEQRCETCLDVIMYCTCWIPPDMELNESESFEILSATASAYWKKESRRLEGNPELIARILKELDGEFRTVCDVGSFWFDERDPLAVAHISDTLGYRLGPTAPRYGYER